MNENCVKKFTTSVSSIYVVTVTFVVELPEVIAYACATGGDVTSPWPEVTTRACPTGTFCTIVVVQNVSLRMIGSWGSRPFFGYFDRKWRYLLEGSLRFAHAKPEVGDFFKFFFSSFFPFLYIFSFCFFYFYNVTQVTLHFKLRENYMFS